ncbi:MAG TPA: hypothetical protein VHZ97_07475 [Pseudonocardiaceae bacterium]|jgi:hypothetical protein|nr:hypothetical protein [Pseudonocardiaceae bacterium]
MTGVRRLADYRREKAQAAAARKPQAMRYLLYMYCDAADELDERSLERQMKEIRELAEDYAWVVTESVDPVTEDMD